MPGPVKVRSMTADESDAGLQEYLDHQHFEGGLPDSIPTDEEVRGD